MTGFNTSREFQVKTNERRILGILAVLVIGVVLATVLVWSSRQAAFARIDQQARNQMLLEQVDQTNQADD